MLKTRINLTFILFLAFLFSTIIFAEINILGTGQRAVIISSSEISTLGSMNNTESTANQIAAKMCQYVGAKFVRAKYVEWNNAEISDVVEKGIYRGVILEESNGGIIYTEKIFPLQPYRANHMISAEIEKYCYGGSLISFVSGGLTSLLIGFGIYGENLRDAAIVGCVSGGVTIILASTGLFIGLYRKYLKKRKLGETPLFNLGEQMQTFALPIMATEIWCEY